MQDMFNKRTPVTVAAVAGILTLIVFVPALFNGFVNYDDNRFVTDNPGIRSFDTTMLLSALTQQFSNDYWTPLTWISFAIDYRLWGLNPFGYHLENILLHAINTVLVVLICNRILQKSSAGPHPDMGGEAAGQNKQVAYLYALTLLFAGLAWGLHPLRVESVAWVAERKDVLYGMFTLSSVLCYLRYLSGGPGGGVTGPWRYYAYSTGFYSLALMAKPTSVFLPMLLLVADWYPFDRLRGSSLRRALAEKVPYMVLAAMATAMTVSSMTMTSPLYSYNQFTFLQRTIVAGHTIVEYCRLMFVPIGIHLFNALAPVLAEPLIATVKTVCVATFTVFLIGIARNRPWAPAAWFAFLIPLLPTLPYFQVGVDVAYSTRHSYLPMVVPSIVLAALLGGAYRKAALTCNRTRQAVIVAAVISFLMVQVVMTRHLITFWKDSGTLWSRVISIKPIGRAYSYRAMYYMENRQFAAAAADFIETGRRAEEAGNPGAFNYFALAGDAFSRAGLYREAVEAFTTAIAMSPLQNYYFHRGNALKALGRLREADEDFKAAGAETGEIEVQQLW